MNTTLKVTEIGTAILDYDELGNVMATEFIPSKDINIVAPPNLGLRLFGMDRAEDENMMRTQAERVMAAWFSKATEVELADRDQYRIEAVVTKCERYEFGGIFRSAIKFFLKPI